MTRPPAEPETMPADSPSHPSPPPTPSSTKNRVTAPLLGVRQTRSTSTTTSPASETAGADGDGPPLSDPLDAPPPPTSTPSASDREGTEPLELDKDGLKETARGFVLATALGLHKYLARSDVEQELGLWLMSEKEAARVGDPLASIAKRRAGGTAVDPDTGDLIRAGAAAAAYIAKNAVRAVQIRLAMRRNRRMATEPEEEHAA